MNSHQFFSMGLGFSSDCDIKLHSQQQRRGPEILKLLWAVPASLSGKKGCATVTRDWILDFWILVFHLVFIIFPHIFPFCVSNKKGRAKGRISTPPLKNQIIFACVFMTDNHLCLVQRQRVRFHQFPYIQHCHLVLSIHPYITRAQPGGGLRYIKRAFIVQHRTIQHN